jgi:hypothetical protein
LATDNNLDLEQKFNDNMRILLRFQLSLEDYILNTNDDVPLLNEAHKDLGYIRSIRKTASKEQLLKLSEDTIEKFKKVVDIVGKDKFTFYDDGKISYIWDYSLLKKKED